MMCEESTRDISEEERQEEDDGWKSEHPATFWSALEGGSTEEIHNVWYFDNRTTVFSCTESKVCRLRRK